MEFLGEGVYLWLAGSNKKNPELASVFRQFAAHESGHGRMFSKLYADHGNVPPARHTWVRAGKVIACCQGVLPLRWRLKILNHLESGAVENIESVLKLREKDEFFKILEAILPHERQHAALYHDRYQA